VQGHTSGLEPRNCVLIACSNVCSYHICSMKRFVGIWSGEPDASLWRSMRMHDMTLGTACSTPDRLLSGSHWCTEPFYEPHEWAIKKDTACPLPHPASRIVQTVFPPNHWIHMSMVMANIPSSAPMVTEPGKGDPQRFQIDSSENRRVISIEKNSSRSHSPISLISVSSNVLL
jgi:hypothetical protein